MEENKIRIGITQGDINGVGYEVILKTFSDPTMLELCTPIIYGSPKVAAYHRKALDVQANFSIVNTASEAGYNRLSVVNCTDDEVKVEFSKPDPEAGKAALGALERAIEEYREGLIDVIVTAPINKHTIQSEEFSFPGHTEYIEERGNKSLMILMKNDFRVALVTTHIPVREIATTITKELIQEKLMIFHRCLKQDFGIGAPRIAVLSLNPHAGDGGLLGMEEQEVIIPAMKEMEEKGYLQKIASEEDGRVTYITVTKKGSELSQKYDEQYFDSLLPYMEEIPDEDAECMIQTIEKFYQIMCERRKHYDER